MRYTLKLSGYTVTGDYTPANPNYGRRGEPADTPPEPASFDIVTIFNAEGEDILPTLNTKEIDDFEKKALGAIAEMEEPC